MSLDLLANELVQEIAASLPHRRDLKNLSCVCKSVNYATQRLVFSSIVISMGTADKMALVEHLLGANTFALHVRTLKIEGLNAPRRISKRRANKNPDEETVNECAKKFWGYLQGALESLVNVRRVAWIIYEMDPSSSYRVIVDCLSRMQFLSDLSILSLCDNGFTIPIKHLECSNLIHVSLEGWDISDPKVAAATAMLIARHAGSLRSLRLQIDCHQETFESLLKRSPEPIVLHLRVLELEDLSVSKIPAGINLRTLETLQVTQLSDEGWRGLEAAHVRLRHLRVESVTEALLSYLASYQGRLEELTFNFATARPNPESDARLSAYFYHSILPKHAATLRSFEILGNPGWVHKSHLVFGRCRLLEKLTVGVNIDFNSPSDVVATFLRFAIAHPTLTRLTFSSVSRHHMDLVARMTLKEAILKTCFPGSINRDLQVDIGVHSITMLAGSNWFIEN